MINIISYLFKQNKPLPAENLVLFMYELMQNGVMNKFIWFYYFYVERMFLVY
ncbi:MAG: hypothetical protein WCQ54_13865 [Clostridiaceae bacterium]